MHSPAIERKITLAAVTLLIATSLGAGYANMGASLVCLLVAIAAMPAIRFKRFRRIKIWTLFFAALMGGMSIAAHLSEARAQAFCDSYALGQAFSEAAAAAANVGEPHWRRIEPQQLVVGFTGVSAIERHICSINARDGVIVNKEYRFLD
jgi:hypothetical protein